MMRGDGGNKAWSPGRARISRNTIAQGRPVDPARTCGSCPVLFFTHGGHGCGSHPVFPAPSDVFEGGMDNKTRTPCAAGARTRAGIFVAAYPSRRAQSALLRMRSLQAVRSQSL